MAELNLSGSDRDKRDRYRIEQLDRDMDIDPEYYTGWEKDFVRSVKRTIAFTLPQSNTIDNLWKKHLKR